MTLRRLHVWHALKLSLALQGTVATCKARFGGLSDVEILLQNSSDMCLLKIIKFGWHLANLLHTVKDHFYNNANTDKWIIIFTRYGISTVNRCGG